MDKEYKSLCQVFTPTKNAEELLNWCDYKKDIEDQQIIENSCGNGNILKQIVIRLIESSLTKEMSLNEIKEKLENNIYGIEYDNEKYQECIKNLNEIAKKYNIKKVNWKHIVLGDALLNYEKNKYDYVVGNPPYIKYKSLYEKDRKYIRDHFETCKKGKFDYCYAFIEMSLKSLKDGGRMAYLIPSSIFKNVFAEDLREYMKPHIEKIYDYTTTKLFTKETNDKRIDRLTSSAIIVLKKNSKKRKIEYIDVTKNKKIEIDKANLGKKWIFQENSELSNRTNRFGDYFQVSNTIATLYNKAYVLQNYEENETYIIVKNKKIEKEIVKDTISPKNLYKNKKEKIIFPYYYNQKGQLHHYSEEEFKKRFPCAYEYLENQKKNLVNRKSDKSALWFEYGRSQALSTSNQEKILLSTIITKKVNCEILSSETIPYSGLYVTKKSKKSLKFAEKILKSPEFLEYIYSKGILASGNSVRITSKDILEYRF